MTQFISARLVSLSITSSQNLLKLMSFELVMPSNRLILCPPLFLPSIFPSIRVFSKESALCIRWPLHQGDSGKPPFFHFPFISCLSLHAHRSSSLWTWKAPQRGEAEGKAGVGLVLTDRGYIAVLGLLSSLQQPLCGGQGQCPSLSAIFRDTGPPRLQTQPLPCFQALLALWRGDLSSPAC